MFSNKNSILSKNNLMFTKIIQFPQKDHIFKKSNILREKIIGIMFSINNKMFSVSKSNLNNVFSKKKFLEDEIVSYI